MINQSATRYYKKSECISFKSTKHKHGGLSNMAPGYTLQINGNIVRTSEALYQALKFPLNPEIQKKIISSNSPMTAKKISRYYDRFTRPNWNAIRYQVMRLCIEIKLHQNYTKFSKDLLETKDLPIVEFTYKDKVWGAVEHNDQYVGINALGRLLMELRHKIKNDNFQLTVPDIELLTLFTEEITLKSFDKIQKSYVQTEFIV